jgi:hypothetical protein
LDADPARGLRTVYRHAATGQRYHLHASLLRPPGAVGDGVRGAEGDGVIVPLCVCALPRRAAQRLACPSLAWRASTLGQPRVLDVRGGVLRELTVAKRHVVARCVRYQQVVKFSTTSADTSSGVISVRGHCVSFAHRGADALAALDTTTTLPRLSVDGQLMVAFCGPLEAHRTLVGTRLLSRACSPSTSTACCASAVSVVRCWRMQSRCKFDCGALHERYIILKKKKKKGKHAQHGRQLFLLLLTFSLQRKEKEKNRKKE